MPRARVCRALDAQGGAQYVLGDESTLRLMGTYATSAGDGVRDRWPLGEGLIALAPEENAVPEDALRIRWAFDEAVPRHVVVFPVLHEGEVRGIIELGTLHRVSELHLQLRNDHHLGFDLYRPDEAAKVTRSK